MMPLAARRLFVIAALVLLSTAPQAPAQTWTGVVDNNWGVAGNWDTNVVPSTGNATTFNDAGNGNRNISLGGPRSVNTIQFSTASTGAYNLGVLNSADQFNIDSNGVISVDSAVANLETINAVVATGGDMTVSVANSSAPASNLGLRFAGGMSLAPGFLTINGTGAITIDRPITGDGFIQLDLKAGALNLNAQNTYSGDTYFLNNATGGQQPAIRIGVDSVGLPGAIVSGPFGTGKFIAQSVNPPVFQAIGGNRTIANDLQFDRGIFVGALNTAPLPVGETAHSLTLTGTLSTPGRIFTNNLPAGASLNFGSATVTNPFTMSGVTSFQTQNATSGNGGGLTVFNDPITGASGGLTAQNSAIVVLNNANNDYGGATLVTGTGGIAGTTNPTLLVNGAKTGTGTVTINTRCNSTTSTDVACTAATADPTKPLRGVGLLGGTGSIAGNVTNNGIIAPGVVAGTPGTLTLTGNLTDGSTASPVATASHWAIELNGTVADKLAVTGDINLAAVDNLDISGTGSGSSWVIATYAGTLTGTFDVVTPGYSVNYGAGSNSQITLNVAPIGVPGDYNNNGTVDAGDYVIWRKLNGQAVALPNEVSGTTTGQVTQEDYNAWRARFGNPSGSASSLGRTAVPEPGSLVLVVLAIGTAFFFQRR